MSYSPHRAFRLSMQVSSNSKKCSRGAEAPKAVGEPSKTCRLLWLCSFLCWNLLIFCVGAILLLDDGNQQPLELVMDCSKRICSDGYFFLLVFKNLQRQNGK
jgi:hypothetical protein